MQKNTTESTLKINNLTKTYVKRGFFLPFLKSAPQTTKALNHVSFTLTNGLYGLLGPNGAGKSTLINIITGALNADSGVCTWNGKNIKRLGIEFRRVLGYMPQQQNLYPQYTGQQFLSYMAALKEIPKSNVVKEVETVAAEVNLTDELGKRLSAYSGGMKQRLLVASAMIGSPKLLIMDEPTAGLDPKERVRLRSLLVKISKNSIVLVATHVVSDVEFVADKILLLKNGELVDCAPPEKLIKKHSPAAKLEDVYLSVFGDEGRYI